MNREEHHAKADQLLEQARDAYDPVSRSQILAEAHVHATLALSAEPRPAWSGTDCVAQNHPRGRPCAVRAQAVRGGPQRASRTRRAAPVLPGYSPRQPPAEPEGMAGLPSGRRYCLLPLIE